MTSGNVFARRMQSDMQRHSNIPPKWEISLVMTVFPFETSDHMASARAATNIIKHWKKRESMEGKKKKTNMLMQN